jgi:hypothetical protein
MQYASDLDPRPTTQADRTYFYNRARRARLEKPSYVERSRSSRGHFKPLLDPGGRFSSETVARRLYVTTIPQRKKCPFGFGGYVMGESVRLGVMVKANGFIMVWLGWPLMTKKIQSKNAHQQRLLNLF